MMRTQIYIPKSLYQRIALLARQTNLPKSEVVRELLEAGLLHKQARLGQGLDALIRLGERLKVTGPADLSRNLDHYLYDDENNQ